MKTLGLILFFLTSNSFAANKFSSRIELNDRTISMCLVIDTEKECTGNNHSHQIILSEQNYQDALVYGGQSFQGTRMFTKGLIDIATSYPVLAYESFRKNFLGKGTTEAGIKFRRDFHADMSRFEVGNLIHLLKENEGILLLTGDDDEDTISQHVNLRRDFLNFTHNSYWQDK